MKKTIKLNGYEIERCEQFAKDCAEYNAKSKKQYNYIYNKCLLGKLGDVAFKKFLMEDYAIYEPMNCDYSPKQKPNNIKIGDFEIIIKSTTINNKWLLVSLSDFSPNGQQAFILTKVDLDTKEVEISGAISNIKFNIMNENVFYIKQGQSVPDTKSKHGLNNDCLGIKEENIEHDIDKVMQYIIY